MTDAPPWVFYASIDCSAHGWSSRTHCGPRRGGCNSEFVRLPGMKLHARSQVRKMTRGRGFRSKSRTTRWGARPLSSCRAAHMTISISTGRELESLLRQSVDPPPGRPRRPRLAQMTSAAFESPRAGRRGCWWRFPRQAASNSLKDR